MEVIFMLLMFLLFIGISLNDVTGNQKWSSLLKSRGIILIIIFWSLSGFILRIHFSTFTMLYSGPEAVLEPLWGFKNIAMALVPILLFVGSTYVKKQSHSFWLLCIELSFWLFIFLFGKGSYGWGYYPEGYYMMYDYISLFLRALLMLHFLGAEKHRFAAAWFLAHVVVSCKVNVFGGGCFG